MARSNWMNKQKTYVYSLFPDGELLATTDCFLEGTVTDWQTYQLFPNNAKQTPEFKYPA